MIAREIDVEKMNRLEKFKNRKNVKPVAAPKPVPVVPKAAAKPNSEPVSIFLFF